nr:glycoside-pentoside-hexuronide (GPH):cation symporter [Bifidobacterium simiarum]
MGFRSRISFALAEVGIQFSWTLVSSYLTLFYTDAVGLAPAVISIIMLGARVFDAFFDPMMGVIEDRTRTKWGRYRPYILFGAPALAVFNVLTFSTFDVSNGFKVAYATVTYVLFGIIYAAVCIAQGSLSNVMTRDNNERNVLNSFRGVAAGFAGLVLSAITMPIILYFGKGNTSSAIGFTMAAVVLSLLSLPCLWITFANCKEVITAAKDQHKNVSVWHSLKVIFLQRNFLLEMIFVVITLIALFGRFAVLMHYYIYVLGRADLVAMLSMVMTLAQLVSNCFVPYMAKRLSKKYCLCIANIGMALGCVLIYLAGIGDARLWMVILGTGMMGFFNFLSPLLYGLTAELVDDTEVREGVREDGAGYSTFSFATKLGNAFGGSIGVMCLGFVGFHANTEHSPAVKMAMSGVINLGPAALYLLALIPLLMIAMTNKKAAKNTEILKARAKEREAAEAAEAEAAVAAAPNAAE